MNSTVTTRDLTTIPKAVREKLGIAVHDSLEWVVDKGNVVVQPVHSTFLSYRGSMKTGSGDITADIQSARDKRDEQF